MIFHSRSAQAITLATGSALAFVIAALSDHAQAQCKLDARYTISFSRIRVGDITATVVLGDSEYAISARGHAGGVMKILVDGARLIVKVSSIHGPRCYFRPLLQA